jgi:hypothetical protein
MPFAFMMTFLDSMVGFMGGSFQILKTTDGGENWETTAIDSGAYPGILGIHFSGSPERLGGWTEWYHCGWRGCF